MQVTGIGAGAMGCLFGAALQRSGHAVTVVDTRADTVHTLNRRGVTVEEPGGARSTVRLAATTNPSDALAADLFLVFVKTPNTETALRPFAGRLPMGALVVTMQNGLGNEEVIARALGRRVPVVLGVTSHTSVPLGVGQVRHSSNGPTIIGFLDGTRSPQLENVAAAFSESGIATRTTRHVRDHVWQKLLVNTGLNALTALTGLTNGELLSDAELVATVRRLVTEAATVARAENVALPEHDAFALVRAVAEVTRSVRSSMLQDIDAGRVTEIDAINGAIVRLGERHGVDVTANRLVTALVHQRERQKHGK